MSKFDVIIVGAGLAGLIAGAKLSKEGKNVLLIEAHHTVGGCATSFKRKEYTFEVGLHEMDGLGNELDPKQEIFKDLEVMKNVKFQKVPEFYRVKSETIDFIMPDNATEAIKKLQDKFPSEKQNIADFFDEMQLLSQMKMKSLFKRRNATLGEVLDEYFTAESLKLIICTNIAYYHDNPYELSFIYFSVAQMSYLQGGGWYIQGGSLKLSQYLADFIIEHGGTIILKHEVTEILLDDKKKKAIGVTYKRMKRDSPAIQSAYAEIIIANTAVPNLAKKLIPSLNESKYAKQVDSQALPCSLLSVYLAFKDHDFKNKYYSTFVFDNDLKKLKNFSELERSDNYNKKGFVFVDYSIVGEPLIGTICAIDYLRNWEGLTKEEYKQKKKEVTNLFIDRLEKEIPGIRKSIVYSEMATPRTIVKYTRNPKGVVYGFAETPDMVGKKRLEKATPPIDNLFIASAWGNIGGGYSGAMLTGYKTAKMLLKKNKI